MNNKTSGKYHASVTSSFSKTKGFFCFLLNKRSPKDALGKLSFLHTLFLENEAQINKNNAFYVKTGQSAGDWLDPAENKSRPKMLYTPFLHKSLQIQLIVLSFGWKGRD